MNDEQEKRIAYLEARLTAMTKWLEKNQCDVWGRGLWVAISEAEKNAPNPLPRVPAAFFERMNKGGSGEFIAVNWNIPPCEIPDSGALYFGAPKD